jgi:hypothetical protein
MMVYHLFVLFSLFLVGSYAQEGWSVTVVNNVAPCSNGNYATISLFPTNGQQVLAQGNSYIFRVAVLIIISFLHFYFLLFLFFQIIFFLNISYLL